MFNNKSRKILDQSYRKLLAEVLDYIINHDEQASALKLFRNLSQAVHDHIKELKLQPLLLDFYKTALIKLQFISLSALDDKEVIGLLKDNFSQQFTIPYYNLLQKIAAKVLNIIVVKDRNKFKETLRQVILENNSEISPHYEIKTIKEWLKNYVAKVGIDGNNKLAKAQYLITLKRNNISPKEYDNLVLLFNFYDYLNIPADSPVGLPEEFPVMLKGKLYIFRKGILETVKESKKFKEALDLLSNNKQNLIKNDNLDKITPLNNISSAINDSNDNSDANQTKEFQLASSEQLTALEQALRNYSADSLEHKALTQEINRLKSGSLRRAQQKSHVKK